jgi:hypothetical protein
VTKLDLSNCHLSGSLLSDIGKLTELTSFAIWGNRCTGPLPSFANCKKLKDFRCCGNSFEGPLPSFGECTQLEWFECQVNQFTGILPSFAACVKLEMFSCNNNSFTGRLPSFEVCSELEWFICNDCSFTGIIPSFERCRKLEDFCCSSTHRGQAAQFTRRASVTASVSSAKGNRFSAVGTWIGLLRGRQCRFSLPQGLRLLEMRRVSDVKAAVRLDFSKLGLAGPLPSFAECQVLTHLYLHKNQLSKLSSFALCKRLEKLWAQDNILAGPMPSFAGCDALRQLNLSCNRITGLVPSFSKCKKLEVLNVRGNRMTGLMPSFAGCTQLNHLNCAANRGFIVPEGMPTNFAWRIIYESTEQVQNYVAFMNTHAPLCRDGKAYYTTHGLGWFVECGSTCYRCGQPKARHSNGDEGQSAELPPPAAGAALCAKGAFPAKGGAALPAKGGAALPAKGGAALPAKGGAGAALSTKGGAALPTLPGKAKTQLVDAKAKGTLFDTADADRLAKAKAANDAFAPVVRMAPVTEM